MYLLNKEQYYLALESLSKVEINHLFADAVIQQMVSGKLYANHIENPSTFYAVHPYGLTLLFGDDPDADFSKSLFHFLLNVEHDHNNDHWIQCWPVEYCTIALKQIKELQLTQNAQLGSYERVNFSFNCDKYKNRTLPILQPYCTIVETDQILFESMPGTVIPSRFWDNNADFLLHGKGFSLLENGKLASTAYAAFVVGHQLEIGIETVPEFRGKGYAFAVCQAIIDYCLQNNFEPVWACRADNHQSIALAEKLGFVETVRIPFYHLRLSEQ